MTARLSRQELAAWYATRTVAEIAADVGVAPETVGVPGEQITRHVHPRRLVTVPADPPDDTAAAATNRRWTRLACRTPRARVAGCWGSGRPGLRAWPQETDRPLPSYRGAVIFSRKESRHVLRRTIPILGGPVLGGPVLGAAVAVALLSAAALAASAPAGADPTPFVLGGHTAEAPVSFAGSLQWDHNGDPDWHSCGVTLIGAHWALGNAHCYTDPASTPGGAPTLRRTRYHLRVGSLDRRSGVVVDVDRVTVAPGWRYGEHDPRGRVDDIAVLHLAQPVRETPALITRANPARPTREIGWGVTGNDPAAPAARYLQQLDGVHIVDPAACAGIEPAIGTDELCVQSPPHSGVCYGDSGSPILQAIAGRYVLAVGGNSRGPEGRCGDAPGVVVAYADHLTWIYRVITGTARQHVTARTLAAAAG